MARPATLRLLAARLLRTTLITALRQEGHAFTDQRFHAWFAGVATLSDPPPREARPPRVVCAAILTELTHSRWEPFAALADRFSAALLAPRDPHAPADVTAHAETAGILAAARELIARLEPSPLPLPALGRLHNAIGHHALFAPPERSPEPITLGPLRLAVERAGLPSPSWALEMLWGEHWHEARLVACPLPFPGLVRLDAVGADAASVDSGRGDVRRMLAAALRDVARDLNQGLAAADHMARRLAELQPGRRRSSRAPALLALLAGFGPLRSAQLETLLGASRLGVRTMLAALADSGVLVRTTLAGVHLYSANLDAGPAADPAAPAAGLAFSSAALDAYDTAMADIDALLARSGIRREELDAEGEPMSREISLLPGDVRLKPMLADGSL